jgi:hypothetical protein
MTNSLTHNHSDDRSELLSGYLDRALDVADYRRAEQTLRECGACVAELSELRTVQSLLRELPAPVPRRSFTIDPAMVRPRRLWFPVFRFASLAAAMLLVVVLGVDALATGGGQATTTMTTESSALKEAPAAGGAMDSMPEAANEAVTEAPAAALQAPAPTTAAEAQEEAAPAAEAPAAAGTSVADAAAAPAPQATEQVYDAAGAEAEATGETFGMMEATEAAALALPQDTAVAGGDVGDAPETLRQSDNAASETQSLDAPAPEPVAPPLDLWRLAAYALALLMLAFGGAWWWAARRGI